MSYLSVSTWSLHRLLGPLRWTYWDADAREHRTHVQDQPQVHSLLELPAEASRRGYRAVEICHFHFPSTDAEYAAALKRSFEDAGISFDTLLLDYGDLTAEASCTVVGSTSPPLAGPSASASSPAKLRPTTKTRFAARLSP